MDKNKSRSINKKAIALVVIALIFIGLLVFEIFPSLFSRQDRQYIFNTITVVNLQDGNAIEKHITQSGNGFFILDTADGLSFYSADGSRSFRHGHGIRGGRLFGNGDFAAVVAPTSRVVNVYNQAGLVYSTMAAFPVHRFALGSGGWGVALLYISGSGGYELVLFDNRGIAHHLLHLPDYNVMPTAIAIHDNTVAISKVDINNARLNSTVTILNILNQSGAYTGEVIASSLDNQEQLIAQLNFTSSGLVAVSDKGLVTLDAYAATAFDLVFYNRVAAFSFGALGGFAIAYGDGLLSQGVEPSPRGSVSIYGPSGQVVGGFENAAVPSYLHLGNSHVIVQLGGFYVKSFDGGISHPLPLLGNIISAGFLGDDSTVVALTATGFRVLQLSRGS